jgi:hypothetical protein
MALSSRLNLLIRWLISMVNRASSFAPGLTGQRYPADFNASAIYFETASYLTSSKNPTSIRAKMSAQPLLFSNLYRLIAASKWPDFKTYNTLRGRRLNQQDEFAVFQTAGDRLSRRCCDYSTNEPTMDCTADAILMMAVWSRSADRGL